MRYILLFLFIINFNAQSQQVISSAGNVHSGNINVNWTIGEGLVTTQSNASIYITQGFQQPLFISELPIDKELTLELIAYPNPTYDKVLFKGDDEEGMYYIRVVDKLGKILHQSKLPRSELQVEMTNYQNGTYLIEVIKEDSEKKKVFNVVKISN